MRSDGGRGDCRKGVKRKWPREERDDQGETRKKNPREQGQCVTKNQYDIMSHIVPKKN